ncbi:MAG TPA: MBL fold metallo-hydrolase, partial [Chloroflexota bacterium]|nr:MBL fold metallo-hydrolase [Chloroflexota bacterium]
MKITFWGTRGSIAVPGHATATYGGNTSCVEVRMGGELFVLDCGTGIRELGHHLLAAGEPLKANVLLGHSHWD